MRPEWLDEQFDLATSPAIPWELRSLAEAFAPRLIWEMSRTAGLEPALVELAAAIRSYVVALPGGVESLRAAQVGREFGLRRPEREPLHERMLRAYTGNMPAAFDGRLASLANGADVARALPAGPDASPEEREILAAWYERAIEQDEQAPLVSTPVGPRVAHEYVLDVDALCSLSFREIIDLREAAAPRPYFRLRHHALRAPAALETHAEEPLDERDRFLARLVHAQRCRVLHRRHGGGGPAAISRVRPPDDPQGQAVVTGLYIPGTGELTALLSAPAQGRGHPARSLRRTNRLVLARMRERLSD